jgi:quercetin dioxygenase-like cupin family protein
MRLKPIGPIIAVALLALVAIIGRLPATAQDGTSGATPAPAPQVVREVLGEAEPDSAPGESFELSRYIIPAGAVLPAHTHPGVQMAIVESGTLTYHVVENGSITVTRADGTEEVIGPGETATMEVGDAWVEPEGMVHYAENLTGEPVILLSASLFTEGEPASEIVDLDATPEATPAS